MMVVQAIEFAALKHKGQVRKFSGLPYVIHTIITMELIQRYKSCSKYISELKCAAALHDSVEDTDCTYLELEREFGPMVASIVLELTSDEAMIAKMGKLAYLKQKMVGMSKYAFILKLMDRMANMMDNPKPQGVLDTIELMNYLLENRPDLTNRQIRIMGEIKAICLDEEVVDEYVDGAEGDQKEDDSTEKIKVIGKIKKKKKKGKKKKKKG